MATSKNKLYVGDNLNVMHGMNSNSVDLIYLDPPFNSKRIYSAPIGSPAEKKASAKGALKQAGFNDIWVWNEDVDIRLESFLTTHPHLFAYINCVGYMNGLPMKAYLTFMAQRMIEMHRVLKDTGSLYLHCDPTASHYLKIILDYVFGKNNFRNEIIWSYRRWPAKQENFQRMHDVIFRYAMDEQVAWNQLYEPLAESTLKSDKGKKIINVFDEQGRRKRGIKTGEESPGAPMRDVWDIGIISPTAKERTGYPTQKPLALLDRIIKASSNPGDMVLDPFCGCATTCVAAHNLHRNWIGIDVSDVAVDLVRDRLTYTDDATADLFTDFIAIKTMPKRSDLELLNLKNPAIRTHILAIFYGKQAGNCNGCKAHFPEPRHFHIDHMYPQSHGGVSVWENLQLLCGSCNSIKGNRPMEYLLATIKARRAQTSFY